MLQDVLFSCNAWVIFGLPWSLQIGTTSEWSRRNKGQIQSLRNILEIWNPSQNSINGILQEITEMYITSRVYQRFAS